MLNKKLFKKVRTIAKFIIFAVVLNRGFCISLSELIELSMQNNPDIISAKINYDSANLSTKTLDGSFAPGITFSSSASLPQNYEWNTNPDYFSGNVNFSQPLPGGTSLSLGGSYSLNSLSAVPDMSERFVYQTQGISFTISQSLMPFWAQGKNQDPTILSARQQANYYKLQLLYTQKSVVQNLVQNYAFLQIYKNQIKIYKNTIELYNEQIKALEELKKSGSTNQAQITELENSKWNYEENLISAQSNYLSCTQNLKNICAFDFKNEKNDDFGTEENFWENFSQYFDTLECTATDPLEEIYKLQIEMLQNSRTKEKQTSAPTLNFSLQSGWTSDSVINSQWTNAWDSENSKVPTWSAGISVNLSPLINSVVAQNKQKYEKNLESAENSYISYLQKKDFSRKNYEILIKNYSEQLDTVSKLYETSKNHLEDFEIQFKAGAISKLDYISAKVRTENLLLNKKCTEIYKWLYEFFLKTI